MFGLSSLLASVKPRSVTTRKVTPPSPYRPGAGRVPRLGSRRTYTWPSRPIRPMTGLTRRSLPHFGRRSARSVSGREWCSYGLQGKWPA